jgi:hypothetical protein
MATTPVQAHSGKTGSVFPTSNCDFLPFPFQDFEYLSTSLSYQFSELFLRSLPSLRPFSNERLSGKVRPPLATASVVRAKAAMRGHFKTGHMKWPGT